MEVHCSKGTYIRTLCNDIGEKLGCGACMEELIRTKVSRFELKDSITLDEVRELKEAGKLDEYLVPIDAMFDMYEAVTLKDEFVAFAYNGNLFKANHLKERIELTNGKQVRAYDEAGRFIAIYEYQEGDRFFHIQKMFLDKSELA